MNTLRKEFEFPQATAEWGWKYHHIGIPLETKMQSARDIPHLKLAVKGFDTSPYGIEWMYFEPDADFPEIIKKIPHIAFVVENLDEALQNKKLLVPPNEPSGGVRVAMIEHDGAPIELMEFCK